MLLATSFRRGRRARLAVAAFAAALLALPSGASGVSAHQATPDAPACTVRPIDPARIGAMIGGIVTVATPAAVAASAGSPVDAAVAAAVAATVRESVACVNANQPLRWFALFTDRYLVRRFGGANADDLGHLIAAATRSPSIAAPDDQLVVIDVTDVRTLADGRVAAVVVTANRNAAFADQLTFVEIGGRWLIDEVVEGESDVAATPAP